MRWLKRVALGVALGSSPCCSDNGQTGSIGYACHEDECTKTEQEFVSQIGDLRVPHFVDSTCREGDPIGKAGSLGVRHCRCIEADGSVWVIEATGSVSVGAGGTSPLGEVAQGATLESVVSTEPCLAWGSRGHIACVFPASEARSCDTSTPSSCEPVCARWEQGLKEDAVREYEAELRGSYCWNKESSSIANGPGVGQCLAVVRINGACYATKQHAFYAPTPYDCSLSDEEILTRNASADPGKIP